MKSRSIRIKRNKKNYQLPIPNSTANAGFWFVWTRKLKVESKQSSKVNAFAANYSLTSTKVIFTE